MPAPVSDKVKICIDRGGTFCVSSVRIRHEPILISEKDIIALSESKGDHLVKLLSVDPDKYILLLSVFVPS